MKLPVQPPLPPMEAATVDEIPAGDHWQYEPKWDGFRCLAFRDGDEVYLQSKAGKPLTRYFPDLVETLRRVKAERFVLDGELIIDRDGQISFDDLLQRIHPAQSRVRKLAAETPASFIAFDLLSEAGESLAGEPLAIRRPRLERLAKQFKGIRQLQLSPASTDREEADRWFEQTHGGLDGVIAKRLDVSYASGSRDAMVKIKHYRSIDCVVGGFRYASKGKLVGSLLLGLFDGEGRLNHAGFTSSIRQAQKKDLTKQLETLAKRRDAVGFTGSAPGGPSRWSTDRSTKWVPLPHEVVVEVTYDHFSGGRFRHGTGFVRFRPDKAPRQCTDDQIHRSGESSLVLLDPQTRKRERRVARRGAA